MTRKKKRYLNGTEVLSRMRKSDLPHRGCWNVAAYFNDGSKVGVVVMKRLIREGKIVAPESPSAYAEYRLREL